MVRLAALAAAILMATACGSTVTTIYPLDQPAPSPSQGSTDRPSGSGGNPNASPPPHFCGDQLCLSPSPTPR